MSLLDTASLILTPNGYKGGVTTGKLYSVKPTNGDGDMVVTRNTTSTRVDSAGLIESVAFNAPRIDYTGGGCPRILVEPARTNLVLRSEEFDNTYWAKTNTVITANSIISPDGTLNADLISYNSTTNVLSFITTNSITSSYTISVFAQKGTTNVLRIRETFYFGTSSTFDLNAGTVLTGTGKIENYVNGWYRCSINQAYTNLQTSINWSFDSNSTINNLYLWGAQVEAGSNATSYIPTTTASVTRNADVISKTGISSLIGQTEGTIFVEFNNTLMTYVGNGYLIRIFADANNEVWIRKESTTSSYTARWRANSVSVYIQSSIPVLNGNNKIAIAYKSTDSAVYLNGTQIGTSASIAAFSVAPSEISIGTLSTSDFFNDRIELATLFQTRLTNAQLATLTTL